MSSAPTGEAFPRLPGAPPGSPFPADDPNADPRIEWETVTVCPCGSALHPGPVWGWDICSKCYTWVNTRRPTESSLAFVYGPSYWGTTQRMVSCASLEERFESDMQDRVPLYLSAIVPHLRPGAKVAEVGCGNGRIVHELHHAGYDAVGLDYAPDIVARIRRLTDATIRHGGAEALEPGAYDALISIDVFEHAHDPRRFIAEHVRPLRPGGVLVLHTPVHDSPFHPYTYTVGTLWKLYHLYLYGRPLVERLFDEAGFDVVTREVQVFGWPVYVLRKR